MPSSHTCCAALRTRAPFPAGPVRSTLRCSLPTVDTGLYPLGVTIDDEHLAALPLTTHDWHGDWNYTLHHQQLATPTTAATTAATTARPPRRDSTGWAAPPLTGMSPSDWNQLTTALTVPYTAYREAQLHFQRGGP